MYYRRKVILALLQLTGGSVEKISLQKLLLLFSKRQQTPVYEFIPYKYGCYSFSSNADLTVMVRKGMLFSDDSTYTKTDSVNYLNQLTKSDESHLRVIVLEYGTMNSDSLMHTTYVQYPYYATRSETAKRILSVKEFKTVRLFDVRSDDTVLFTIGYEGISLEAYLNKLISNDIKLLVDVRNNPLSMKYGFSKSQLQKYCAAIGVQYIHLPEVGIRSEQRRELNEQADYDKLFTVYRNNNIPNTVPTQQKIVELLKLHKRIALTCFEANIHQCHRKHLAEAIVQLPEFSYELIHL